MKTMNLEELRKYLRGSQLHLELCFFVGLLQKLLGTCIIKKEFKKLHALLSLI